jgi:hypothetical protein
MALILTVIKLKTYVNYQKSCDFGSSDWFMFNGVDPKTSGDGKR